MTASLAEPFDGATVVVTHHAPSPKPVAPRFVSDLNTPAFAMFTVARFIVVIAFFSLLSGCVTANLELHPSNARVPGMRSAMDVLKGRAAGQARLLVIHGMGTGRCPGYSAYRDRYKGPRGRKDGMVTRIATEMDLCLIHDPIPDSPYASCREDVPKDYPKEIVVTAFDYGQSGDGNCDSSRVLMRTYEVYYAGVMEPQELAILERDKRILEMPAAINRWLKARLMITGFGDAVGYLGNTHGNEMRRAVADTICRMMSESTSPTSNLPINASARESCSFVDKQNLQTPESVTDTYLLSHSLGSNIALDTLHTLTNSKEVTSLMGMSAQTLQLGIDSAEAFKERLRATYLMANQQALLQLTGDHDSTMFELSKTSNTVITAFSDRTDVLSYALAEEDCPIDSGRCINAVSNVARFRIPFLFSNPAKAHTGYESDKVVIECIARGCINR